jgi:hypothetical protein
MLTCACGTRFEVDDTLAGKEILCPECQQPLTAPTTERPPRVTSAWALASVMLALIGAFTIVGTVAAVVVGLIALLSIARHRDRVAGVGFAVFGICLGVLFTVLTVVALNAADLFGLESWLRERDMAQKVDTSGPLEIVQGAKGFALSRPNEKWGQIHSGSSGDAAVDEVQGNLDLLLMQVARHAFVDVRMLPGGKFVTLTECQEALLAEFDTQPRPVNPFDDEEDERGQRSRVVRLGPGRALERRDGMEGRETEVEMRLAGQAWHFIIRLYRRGNGSIYVVRAYAPQKRHFAAVKSELETALETFRILGR